jgi:hypothetical protein
MSLLIRLAFMPLMAFSGFGVVHTAEAGTLLLQYDFDEASTGTTPALDGGTGTPAPGTFVGGATRTSNTPAGFSNGALDLTVPGAGTYVFSDNPAKLESLPSFTLTAWINVQATPSGNVRIMSLQAAGAFPGFNWNIGDPSTGAGTRTAANFGLRLFVGGTTAFAFDGTPTLLSIDADQKWAFIAVTYDGTVTENNVKHFVGSADGEVLLGSTTTINAGTVAQSFAKFGVGYTDAAPNSDTAPPAFLDDIRVYSGTLTGEELESVRRENIPEPATAGLLLAGAMALASGRWRSAQRR